ncbi:MAG: STAS domain-containing protein [Gammaproteobacteria bacterium]
MNYEIQSGADNISIHFSGEIDMQYSPVVREQILAQLEYGRALHIDLREVSYMDSSGIACLVEGLQKARAQQLDFILIMPQSQVMQVLQLARLDQVFTIVASE